jgi:ubiquinone/menaquinone biosynthesis C-methylase UbiE
VPVGRKRHPVFARWYAKVSPGMDAGGMADYRQRALVGLAGAVIEVGAGNGLNFPHYPPEVTRVLAIEPAPYLLSIAAQKAGDPEGVIEVQDGVAERLPAADGAFDAAVATLVLCSVADQHAALREIRRVVRPGGQFRFIEHVRADTPGLRRVQRALDATVWPSLGGGCHVSRDTLSAITGGGFTVTQAEAFRFPVTQVPVPSSPHIWGIAVRNP